MFQLRKFVKNGTVYFISISLILLVFSAISKASNFELMETSEPKKLKLVVGKSIILKSSNQVKRISMADPGIAAILLLSPKEIYITGKASGITNLTLWQDKKICTIYELEVDYDISRLKQKLHSILPDEKDLRVIATHNSITLSGRISSAANLSQAMALAKEYAPGGTVHNLLEVGGIHQVMLEVRIAEMSKQVVKSIGVDWALNRGGSYVGTLPRLGVLGALTEQRGFTIASGISSLFFKFENGKSSWTGFIDLLKQNGLAKILAEPTLIALSGQTATFLAGGEFPIPVSTDEGFDVSYKEYGVGLSFTPTVLSKDKISIKVAPEVSEIDYSVAVQIGGYPAPGLLTRKTSTTVELADGQSFAIAGLLKETIQNNITKFPFLGDIPVLGALFRSQSFIKNETELIIIVTPHIVKPLDPGKQTLPTDFYIEPDDTEFYLLGLMEGRENKGELDGEFGHGMPYPD
ncbi:MAG: type II and III secretion system protein family protein [Pseudomonadota bacterium]